MNFKEDYVLTEDKNSKLIRIHPALSTRFYENRNAFSLVIQPAWSTTK